MIKDGAFDITFDSQEIFRSILDAMARPGSIVRLPDINITPPVTNRYPLLVLMTLLDHEVSFCVSGHSDANVNTNINTSVNTNTNENGNRQAVAEYLELNTGSKESVFGDADLILVYRGSSNGLIRMAKQGTLEYPDESATVVYDVGSIGNRRHEGEKGYNKEMLLELFGPGIADKCTIAISGIERAEIEDILELRDYPLGIDAIFSDKAGNIVCIPRSTNARVI